MRIRFCLLSLSFALCQSASAQGGLSIIEYFESDSTARPGYTSIREHKTKITARKNNQLREDYTTETFYDEQGRLVREERSFPSGDGQLTFSYDSTTGRLNYILQTSAKAQFEGFARYDEQGKVSEIVICQQYKSCDYRRYEYDEGNTELVYVPRQSIEFKFDNDKTKSLLGFSVIDKDKQELSRERFFDPEGKLEEIKLYISGKFYAGRIYEYDPSGRKTKVWAYTENQKTLVSAFEYDEHSGLPTTEKIYALAVGNQIIPYGDSGPETVYISFDDRKRLVRTESSGANYSVIREFTYYDY